MAVASWVQSVNRGRCTRSTPGCGGGLNSVDEWKAAAITLQWKSLHRKGGDLLGLEAREGEEWTIPCRVDRESINSILLMRQPRTWKNHINCPWSHNRLEAELELKFRSCDPYLLNTSMLYNPLFLLFSQTSNVFAGRNNFSFSVPLGITFYLISSFFME